MAAPKQISDLSSVTSLSSADLLAVSQNGLTKNTTVEQVFSSSVNDIDISVNGSVLITANQHGFGIGTTAPSNSDDFVHIQRDVNTATGINILNESTGALAEGYIHIWGGPTSGGSIGSGMRMSCNSASGGALVDIVAHDNLAFSIIQQSNSNLNIYTNNLLSFSFVPTSNTVNYFEARGASASSGPSLRAAGSDTDISTFFDAKGAGSHFFRTAGGGTFQFEVRHVASASRRIYVQGSNGSNPIIGVSGGALRLGAGEDIQWGIALVNTGGGSSAALGTVGGSGPATAAQNAWMRVLDTSGAAFWVPAWK